MATYCIGDIQGCYRELSQLLDFIGASVKSDKLWFVGDLVNRGPNSLEVLRLIKELPNAVVVLGNHDLHLLALYYQVIHPATHTLHQVLGAKDCHDLIDWLRYRPLLHCENIHTSPIISTDFAGTATSVTAAENTAEIEVDTLLVHAGVYPFWDLQTAQACNEEVIALLRSNNSADCVALFAHMYGNYPDVWSEKLQEWERWRFIINAFTRLRFCSLTGQLDLVNQGKIGSQPADFMPWFQIPQRKLKDKQIVFGHWAALDGEVGEVSNIFALDTGCVWGGFLTAMCLEDKKHFRVSCKRIM